MPIKVDFERKNVTSYNCCQISTKDIIKHE